MGQRLKDGTGFPRKVLWSSIVAPAKPELTRYVKYQLDTVPEQSHAVDQGPVSSALPERLR